MYSGPSHWTGACSDGRQQSPIDFRPSDAKLTCMYDDFVFTSYSKPVDGYTILNTGTTGKLLFLHTNLHFKRYSGIFFNI